MTKIEHRTTATAALRSARSLLLAAALPLAGCDVAETLGVTDPTARGLVGNVIVHDDGGSGVCGINEIQVTVSGGSYTASNSTRRVSGDLTDYDNGYWNVSNVPIGSTVTITASDGHGQLQDGSVTVSVGRTSTSPPPPQIVAPLRLHPNPRVACYCDGDVGYCEEVRELTRLTNHPDDDVLPAFSADGRIAFNSDRAGNWEIYAMNPDGTGVSRLTNDAASDQSPAWSPDGRRIAFHSTRAGNWEIYAMNADGTGVSRLTNDAANDQSPAWSPDGQTIAFMSNRDGDMDIYVMNADGTGVSRLTDNTDDDRNPSWSADGHWITFHSDRDGNYEVYAIPVPSS